VYAQVIMSLAQQEAEYATNATPEKFWSKWQEKFNTNTEEQQYNNRLQDLKNQPLKAEEKEKLFSDRFKYVRQYFDDLEKENVLPTVQRPFQICPAIF